MKRHALLTLNSSTVTCKKYEFSANISQTTGDTDTLFRPIIAQMQLYILPRDEASRFTDFSFINHDVHKISIHSQYLSNHWRYRHVIWGNFRLDAALYLAQRWSFTVHWLWFYQPWHAKSINSRPISRKRLKIQIRNLGQIFTRCSFISHQDIKLHASLTFALSTVMCKWNRYISQTTWDADT